MRTTEQLLGVEIPYYVRIDYEGFKAIVDTLGGVVIDVERRMYYEDRAQGLKIDLQRGLQRLNGDQALQYVRYRSDGMGDVSLVDPVQGSLRRQGGAAAQVCAGAGQAALSARHLVNAPELISQLFDAVDTNIPPDVALRLLMLVKDASPQDIATAVLPGEGATVGGASYWVVNRPKAQEVINKLIIRRGDMVRVEVLNGNGIDGTASRVADLLRQQGFEVVAVSNADRFDYATTAVIPRQVDLIQAAEQVAGVIGGQVLSASRGPGHPPFSRCRCDRNSRKGLLDLTWAYPVRERKVLGQLKLTGEQIALTAARAADDKRGSGIVVLDLRDISLMTDYFVIVDASSEAQVRAITEGIQEALQAEGV